MFQEGTTYWLADGFMRLQAATKARLAVWVEVRPGCRREAMLFAASANAGHGLPRTSADKRRVVQMLLDDPEWRQWSDARIARACRVSDKTVAKVRRATAPHAGNSGVSQRRYCTKHGTAAVMRLPAAPAPAKSSSALFLGGTSPPGTARPGAADAVGAWEAEPIGANPAVPGEGSRTDAAETLDALLRLSGQLLGLGPVVLRHDVDVSRLDEASDEIRRLLELLQSARGQE